MFTSAPAAGVTFTSVLDSIFLDTTVPIISRTLNPVDPDSLDILLPVNSTEEISPLPSMKLEYISDGVITLTTNRFYYETEGYIKEFNYDLLIQLPFSISPTNRIYFEVPDSEGTFSFCPIEERKEVIRFVQYIDIINSKRLD